MGLFEMNAAAEIIHAVAHPDVNLIFGTVIDDEMGDEVKITVVAAGFDRVDSISGVESAPTSGASRLSELFTDDESEDEEDDGFDAVVLEVNRLTVRLWTFRCRRFGSGLLPFPSRSHQRHRPIDLVVVTKTHPPEVVLAVAAAGAQFVGENYAQEVRDKAPQLRP